MDFSRRIKNKTSATGCLRSQFNEIISINQKFCTGFKDLVDEVQVDALLIEPEDGFSMLGGSRDYLSKELGLPQRNLTRWVMDGMCPDFEPNISSLADWLRFTDPDVTILGIPSRRPDSSIKGLVMVPYEGSNSYRRFAQARYNRPYRDFFYNVTFEGLYYAYHRLGARNFSMTHLLACKYGRDPRYADITLCQVEAILHFCNLYKGINSITFWDFDERNDPFTAIDYLLKGEKQFFHRDISRTYERKVGCDFISLDWPMPANHMLI
jgi:hypothetical protein